MRTSDLTSDGVAPATNDVVEARTARVGVAVHADDETPVLGDDVAHQPFDQISPPAWRDVLELRADEIEPHRRRPGQSVADETALRLATQARPHECRELRHDAAAARLD